MSHFVCSTHCSVHWNIHYDTPSMICMQITLQKESKNMRMNALLTTVCSHKSGVESTGGADYQAMYAFTLFSTHIPYLNSIHTKKTRGIRSVAQIFENEFSLISHYYESHHRLMCKCHCTVNETFFGMNSSKFVI